jgi:cholesterol transport system auxiliary component
MSSHAPIAGRFGWILAVWLVAGCAGCGSFLQSDIPTPVNYVLAPAPAVARPVESPASVVDLSIGRPDVAPGLDTQRIAVLRGRELDYYRAAQWGARTAEVIQTLVVGSLQNQRMFHSVTPEQARVSGEYQLDLEVRDFQAEYGNGQLPTVRVGLVGRLIRITDRRLLETVVASTTRPATENRLNEVTAAFESAGQWAALELARQTSAAIIRDQNTRSVDDKITGTAQK